MWLKPYVTVFLGVPGHVCVMRYDLCVMTYDFFMTLKRKSVELELGDRTSINPINRLIVEAQVIVPRVVAGCISSSRAFNF